MKKSLLARLITSGIITLLMVTGCNTTTTEVKKADVTPSNNNTSGNTVNNTTDNKSEVTKKDPPASGGMSMEPQTPAPLTEEQLKQLEAGKAAHQPSTLTFTVTGGNFYYNPNEIHAKKGDTIKIVFNNAGGFHNFVLDEFKVKTDNINGGETATVEFVADKAGSFEYYCSVGKHRQMGQKGTLIIEE